MLPIFDSERSDRTLAEIAVAAPHLAQGAFGDWIAAASGNSPYLARLMLKETQFLTRYTAQGPGALETLAADALAAGNESDANAVMQKLRVAKRRTALAIGLLDIAGAFDLARVTKALTCFADAAVKGALRFLLAEAARKAGMPETPPESLEANSGLIVLAMGKHGAFELNYSSDIDLVVFYEEEKFPFHRSGDKRGAAVEIVKGLVKLLAETTADGYVFRVDLRLRPDAGATQIAISTESAELYYESMGQNWERAAMIKARLAAGDPDIGAAFLKTMEPYVWRKYLDYAAIEDIHSIKRQIHAHEGHGKIAVLGHNIKLGRGGIREIEFFAQTQQLILGGRDPSLRARATLDALKALCARGQIGADAERELAAAYVFLRTLEHRLQMIEDQQTHTLPKSREGLDHVARFMGYDDTAAFEAALTAHLTKVQGHYARLFESEAPLAADAGSLVFTGVEEDPETLATLTRMGFERAKDVSAAIRGWHHGRVRAMRSARARELLTRLMPALLSALARTADPSAAFSHFDRFLAGLPAGVQVFSMLNANPRLLDLIAEIAGSAPKLAEYLGRNPGVMDALIDPEFLTRNPTPEELRARLAPELERMPGFEPSLDAARRFAKEENFRIGVRVIQGLSDPEEAGPAYALVAETVIAGMHALVEREMDAAHGPMPGGAFAVIALGKLGGREMTASSDLDLVFVYTHGADAISSAGGRPLAPSAYFARASQRFISALTAMTAEGRLYEVDMRLRPSGNQGPVAVRFDRFETYHRSEAWTWERMALTRARVLCGPRDLRERIEGVIAGALTKAADPASILTDARIMRDKLAAQFPGKDNWDIKFAPGGLVDIEFIAQTLQLVHGRTHPQVLDQNTAAALTKLKDAGGLSPADTATLIAAARLENALTQILRIAVEGPFKTDAASKGLRNLLARAGDAPDFSALEGQLVETQREVRAIFNRLIPPQAGSSTTDSGEKPIKTASPGI
jgi:[glutamine synthetase] adenylyltransferase / [glutamine synthetase]-adenylyl-L-tyrosine phosphorylase